MKVYVFVTGASRGLGRAICEAFLSRPDYYVVGLSRSPSSLTHSNYRHVIANLSDVQTLREPSLGNRFFEAFGPIQSAEKLILVNNAGLLTTQYMGNFTGPTSATSPSSRLDVSELDKLITCNMTAPMVLIDAFLRIFQTVAAAKVVLNVGSGASNRPYDGWASYCASKAALLHFSRVLQNEQDCLRAPASSTSAPGGAGPAPAGTFRVLCVAPGIVETDMINTLMNDTDVNHYSRLPEMQKLRSEGVFRSAPAAAAKLVEMMDFPEKFPEVEQRVM